MQIVATHYAGHHESAYRFLLLSGAATLQVLARHAVPARGIATRSSRNRRHGYARRARQRHGVHGGRRRLVCPSRVDVLDGRRDDSGVRYARQMAGSEGPAAHRRRRTQAARSRAAASARSRRQLELDSSTWPKSKSGRRFSFARAPACRSMRWSCPARAPWINRG